MVIGVIIPEATGFLRASRGHVPRVEIENNIPAMEDVLHQRGVLVIPDFVANAGGVISSYAEYRGQNPDNMFRLVKKRIRKNTNIVLQHAENKKVKPRDAALEIARDRVMRKCETCRIEKITHLK